MADFLHLFLVKAMNRYFYHWALFVFFLLIGGVAHAEEATTQNRCEKAESYAATCGVDAGLPAFCDEMADCQAGCMLNTSCLAFTDSGSSFYSALRDCLTACSQPAKTTDTSASAIPKTDRCQQADLYTENCGVGSGLPAFCDEMADCQAGCMLIAPCEAFQNNETDSRVALRQCLSDCIPTNPTNGQMAEVNPNAETGGTVIGELVLPSEPVSDTNGTAVIGNSLAPGSIDSTLPPTSTGGAPATTDESGMSENDTGNNGSHATGGCSLHRSIR